MDLLVVDMRELSVLRAREPGGFVLRHRRAGALFSGVSSAPEGSLLWRLDALDGALRDLRLPTLSGDWIPLGLYNPYTCEVAVGPTPASRAFGSMTPLTFDLPLLEGTVETEGLRVGGVMLPALSPSLERASRSVPA